MSEEFDFESFFKTQITVPVQKELTETFVSVNQGKDILKNYLNFNKLTQQHIDVYNNFIKKASNIILSKIIDLKNGKTISFQNLRFEKPVYFYNNGKKKLYPMNARRNGKTYRAECTVDLIIKKDGQEIYRSVNRVCIAKLPVMLFSSLCYLEGMSDQELIEVGEDPLEHGGYFIVKGDELIILLEEKLSTNRMFIMNSASNIKTHKTSIKLTTNTLKGTRLDEIVYNNNNIFKYSIQSLQKKKDDDEKEKMNQFKRTKKINVIYIFQLFSILYLNNTYCYEYNDIMDLIKPYVVNDQCLYHLYETIAATKQKNKILTPLEVMKKKIDIDLNHTDLVEYVKDILKNIYIHLEDVSPYNNENVDDYVVRITKLKVNLFAIMIGRYLNYVGGYTPLDDRDDWANKRLEGPGRKMEQLLRKSWNKVVSDLIKNHLNEKMINIEIEKQFHSSNVCDTITKHFEDAFKNSKWGIKGGQLENNATQMLNRDNILASVSHINTINVNIQRTDKNIAIRMNQPSQWRYVCFIKSPDGCNVGLVKNLAITTRISLDRGIEGDRIIINLLTYSQQQSTVHTHVILLNGKYIGWCNGALMREQLINARRRGDIHYDVSFYFDDLYFIIDSSPLRLIAPVLIVDKKTQQLVLDLKQIKDLGPLNLVQQGAMEYISALEEKNLKIAINPDDLVERIKTIKTLKDIYNNSQKAYLNAKRSDQDTTDLKSTYKTNKKKYINYINTKPYTHCEISGRVGFGVAADMIPFIGYNQGPRNVYQAAMGT